MRAIIDRNDNKIFNGDYVKLTRYERRETIYVGYVSCISHKYLHLIVLSVTYNNIQTNFRMYENTQMIRKQLIKEKFVVDKLTKEEVFAEML